MQFEELRELDRKDPLKNFREQFHIPKENGEEVIYFCGNSLGLMPRQTEDYLKNEFSA